MMVLETLSLEDLERWRDMSAQIDTLRAEGFAFDPSCAPDAQRIFKEYYALTGELLEKYGVFHSEAVEASISPFTGAIYTGECE